MSNAPTGLQVDIEFTAGVWTNVTASVRNAPTISIRYGRTTPTGSAQVATLALVLDNATGNFTPHNAASTYWPNVVAAKRIRVTYNSGSSPRFLGYIKSWQPVLDGGVAPLVHVAAVDRFDRLSRRLMNSCVQEQILALAPTTYIPLSDASAAPVTSVASYDGSTSYPVRKYGTGTTTITPGVTSPAGAWDSTTWTKFGYSASGGFGATVPQVTGTTFTVMCAIQTSTVTGADFLCWLQYSLQSTVTPWTALGLDASGNPEFYVQNGSGTFVGAFSSKSAADGNAHVLVGVSNGANIYIYLDGVQVGTQAGVAAPDSVGASYLGGDPRAPGSGNYSWNGSLGHFALWQGTALNATQVGLLSSAIVNGFSGDLTGTRLTRVLGYAGMTSADWNVMAGQETMGPCLSATKSLQQNVQDIEITESGGAAIYPDTDGRIRFNDRTYRTTGTPAITIDAGLDLHPGSFLPFLDDFTVFTESVITRSGGNTSTYTNTTAQTTYGTLADSATVFSSTDSAALNIAAYRVNSSQSTWRFPQLAVDLALVSNSSTLYTVLPSVTIGSRLRITNIPTSWTVNGTTTRIYPATSADFYVEGWTETIGLDTYRIVWDLSPADNPPRAVWDDTTYGRWMPDTGSLTLTSNINNSATSMSLTTAGSSPTLSTAAGDYPAYIQIDEEVVKVNSAPGGSTSPQTLTITRAQQGTFADAHTAGAVITVWPRSNWTL